MRFLVTLVQRGINYKRSLFSQSLALLLANLYVFLLVAFSKRVHHAKGKIQERTKT